MKSYLFAYAYRVERNGEIVPGTETFYSAEVYEPIGYIWLEILGNNRWKIADSLALPTNIPGSLMQFDFLEIRVNV